MSGDTNTGAELLVGTAAARGVDVCFANPGTTEMPLVSALDAVPGVRAVLGVFEGVCTGAADGYGRIAGRPAMTLLHLGPGLANGLANLHNARRARSPIVNVVGDHASWHLPYDAPLTSDIAALAGTVGTVRTVASAETIGPDTAAAVDAADDGVSTLIVPADFQQQRVGAAPPSGRGGQGGALRGVAMARVETVAAKMRAGRSVLLLGGDALSAEGLRAAAAIASATGATLYSETFPACAERGGGLPDADRLPYFPEIAARALAGADAVVLAGAAEPVAYFGYEGVPSLLAPEGTVVRLSAPGEDGTAALSDLAAALDARPVPARNEPANDALPTGPLDGPNVGRIVAGLLPENAIVSVEGGTCGYPFVTASASAPRHTVLTNTGGAIGQGLPCALGAAIAAPDRTVIALQSDGSALYTAQALWTMAREGTRVITLIAANHKYNVLRTELDRHGDAHGPQATALTSLADPSIDWVALAGSYGVPARRAATGEDLAAALRAALAEDGPQLIEMAL
ncbi:acetolactate synthase large subunit [Actinomadura sp. 1N219]|uniref:acetolactate synthase large subunit n=1 Tax=Actinomadura sp. 1N219 TaxID=3375152 RepID=UPI00379E45DC